MRCTTTACSSYLKKTTQDRPQRKNAHDRGNETNPGMVYIRILPESGSFVLERIHAPQEQAREIAGIIAVSARLSQ
jgi:hypothetical protein